MSFESVWTCCGRDSLEDFPVRARNISLHRSQPKVQNGKAAPYGVAYEVTSVRDYVQSVRRFVVLHLVISHRRRVGGRVLYKPGPLIYKRGQISYLQGVLAAALVTFAKILTHFTIRPGRSSSVLCRTRRLPSASEEKPHNFEPDLPRPVIRRRGCRELYP